MICLKDKDKMELSDKTKRALAEGHEDIKKGRVFTTEQLIKELGI